MYCNTVTPKASFISHWKHLFNSFSYLRGCVIQPVKPRCSRNLQRQWRSWCKRLYMLPLNRTSKLDSQRLVRLATLGESEEMDVEYEGCFGKFWYKCQNKPFMSAPFAPLRYLLHIITPQHLFTRNTPRQVIDINVHIDIQPVIRGVPSSVYYERVFRECVQAGGWYWFCFCSKPNLLPVSRSLIKRHKPTNTLQLHFSAWASPAVCSFVLFFSFETCWHRLSASPLVAQSSFQDSSPLCWTRTK